MIRKGSMKDLKLSCQDEEQQKKRNQEPERKALK